MDGFTIRSFLKTYGEETLIDIVLGLRVALAAENNLGMFLPHSQDHLT
jgi:hypothetical protein